MDDNFRPVKAYNVAVTATSAQGSAVSAGVMTLRAVVVGTSPAVCYVRFGTNPTAVTGDTAIPPNYPVFFKVSPGEKIAVVGSASGSILNVTECA